MKLLLAAGGVIVGSIGTLSSSCPAIAILSSSSLRAMPMFQMLTNLAITECLFLLTVTAIGMTNLFGMTRSPLVCSLTHSLVSAEAITSSFSLLTLILERYTSVIHGLRYHTILNDANRRLLLASSWIFGTVYWAFHTTLMLVEDQWKNYNGECLFLEVIPPYLLCITFGTILLINIFVIVANLIVSQQAIRQSQVINEQCRAMGLPEELDPMRSFWGILKATVAIMLLVMPINIVLLVDFLITPMPSVLRQIVAVLLIIAYAVDGWLFGLHNAELRDRYGKLFLGRIPERYSQDGAVLNGELRQNADVEFLQGVDCEIGMDIPENAIEMDNIADGNAEPIARPDQEEESMMSLEEVVVEDGDAAVIMPDPQENELLSELPTNSNKASEDEGQTDEDQEIEQGAVGPNTPPDIPSQNTDCFVENKQTHNNDETLKPHDNSQPANQKEYHKTRPNTSHQGTGISSEHFKKLKPIEELTLDDVFQEVEDAMIRLQEQSHVFQRGSIEVVNNEDNVGMSAAGATTTDGGIDTNMETSSGAERDQSGRSHGASERIQSTATGSITSSGDNAVADFVGKFEQQVKRRIRDSISSALRAVSNRPSAFEDTSHAQHEAGNTATASAENISTYPSPDDVSGTNPDDK